MSLFSGVRVNSETGGGCGGLEDGEVGTFSTENYQELPGIHVDFFFALNMEKLCRV